MIEQVLRQCKRQLPKHPELTCFPHWTFLIGTRTQSVLSVGMNRRKEPDKHWGYHNDPDPTFVPKWHAELDAVCKARYRLSESVFIAINVRLSKSGELRMAKPCAACFRILCRFGCRRIYYTITNGLDFVECY